MTRTTAAVAGSSPGAAMTEPTDADLLARFRAGDEAALDPLFARYEGPVFRFLFGLLRDHHRAEDVMQETFVRALRFADGVHPEMFRGWLFTVAHQQAALLKRREKRLPAQADELALVGLEDPAADRAGAADDARRVRELLARLPDPQRAVITARVFEGKSFREVAEALGCPLNTAIGRMHDGLRNLRRLWEGGHA
ncbi:MAG: sigma-70 family RNA polymerase sigma factor [Gemmataceae bacterium]|nr:sigma-70 family RNA polymerase sigma factor [Gemmataceae bacterium]